MKFIKSFLKVLTLLMFLSLTVEIKGKGRRISGLPSDEKPLVTNVGPRTPVFQPSPPAMADTVAEATPGRRNNVIFDVGGVLLELSHFSAFTKLGISCIFHRDIGDRFMDFIDFMEPEQPNIPEADRPKYKDRHLPALMCKWQKGELTCKELADKIKNAADKNPQFFKNKSEQNLIKKSADLLLPEKHVGIERIKASGLQMLRALKNKKDKNGNFVNNLFIISNFDSETFALLQKKFPEIFDLFDPEHIIVSARVNMVKPQKDIFEYTLNKFKLNPKSCIFIDDQLENVNGAQSCGMTAIHHTNAKNTKNRLKALGVI